MTENLKNFSPTKEIAETKVAATERLAEQHEFPLRVSMEPEPEEAKR